MNQWQEGIRQSAAISVVMDMQGHSQACTVSECKSAYWFYLHHRQNHAERRLREPPLLHKYQRLIQSTSPADIKGVAVAVEKAQGPRRQGDDTCREAPWQSPGQSCSSKQNVCNSNVCGTLRRDNKSSPKWFEGGWVWVVGGAEDVWN